MNCGANEELSITQTLTTTLISKIRKLRWIYLREYHVLVVAPFQQVTIALTSNLNSTLRSNNRSVRPRRSYSRTFKRSKKRMSEFEATVRM